MQDISSTQVEHEIKAVSLWPFYLGLFNRTEFLYWYHITKYQNPIFFRPCQFCKGLRQRSKLMFSDTLSKKIIKCMKIAIYIMASSILRHNHQGIVY